MTIRCNRSVARALVVAFCGWNIVACGNGDTHEASRDPLDPVGSVRAALNTTPHIGDFVLYGERSVKLGAHDTVTGGDLGVRTSSPSFGTQAVIGGSSSVQTTHNVIAPSVSLASLAAVGDVETTTLQNNGGTLGTLAAFPSAAMPSSPVAPALTPGGVNVTVPAFTIQTLNPGNYGVLDVIGTMLLTPGKYTFSSVVLASQGHLGATAAGVSVTVGGSLTLGTQATILPSLGLAANQLTITVAGSDVSGTPAVSIGNSSTITTLLAVPHGTLAIGQSVNANGAFSGFDVTVGDSSTLTYQSGFPATTQTGQQGQQVVSSYAPLISGAPLVGPVPPSTPIQLSIGLPLRNAAALQTLISQVSDPTNAAFRQYPSATTFASTYAPTNTDYLALQVFAASRGFTTKATFSDNLTLNVTGTAAQMEQTFYVNLNYYQRPDGTQFYSPDRVPSVDLGVSISGLAGIDNELIIPANDSSFANGSFSASDLRRGYAPCTPQTGAGQKIGIFIYGGFNAADISLYESTNFAGYPVPIAGGTPNVTINPIGIDGYTVPNTDISKGEATQDIEMALALAPNLSQIDVFACAPQDNSNPNTTGVQCLYDALSAMAQDTYQDVLQFSSSFGLPGNEFTFPPLNKLAGRGQAFFSSSGDNGAYQVVTTPQASLVTFPAPWISTGGTILSMRGKGASYGAEVAWPASGGGNQSFETPSFQHNFIVNGASAMYQNFPDVSMPAQSLATDLGGIPQTGGGTSTAAPLWASFTAIANQLAASKSVHSMGFLSPVLYAIASTPALYASSFNDITSGSNPTTPGGGNSYTAGPGYDLVTGLGSPRCDLLYQVASSTPQTAVCPSGQGICGGNCQSFASDSSNCGQCGHGCGGGTCSAGLCQPVTLASNVPATSNMAIDSQNVYWTGQGVTGSAAPPLPSVVMSVPITGGTPSTIYSNVNMAPGAISVADGNVYWADAFTPSGSTADTATLWKIPASGGSRVQLSQPGAQFIRGVFSFGGLVFWAQDSNLLQMPVGGGTIVTVPGGDPHDVWADAQRVLWTDFGVSGNNPGTVNQTVADRTTTTTIATGQADPSGITSDHTSMYWFTIGALFKSTIVKAPLGGGASTTLANPIGVTAIAVDDTNVYFAAIGGSSTGATDGIFSVPTSGNGSVTQLVVLSTPPPALAVDGTNIYWITTDPRIVNAPGIPATPSGTVVKLAK